MKIKNFGKQQLKSRIFVPYSICIFLSKIPLNLAMTIYLNSMLEEMIETEKLFFQKSLVIQMMKMFMTTFY